LRLISIGLSNKYTLAFYLFEQAAAPATPAAGAGIADASKMLAGFGKDLEAVKKTGDENKKNLTNVLKNLGKNPEVPTSSNATTGPTTAVGAKSSRPAGDKTPAGAEKAATGDQNIGDLVKKIDGIEKILSDKSAKKDGITWTTVKEHIVLKVLDRLLLRIL
jgi:hypothetical protein